MEVQPRWIPLDKGYIFSSKEKTSAIRIEPMPGNTALLLTFKAAMKAGSLKQQKVLSTLFYVEQRSSGDLLHVM